MDITELLAFSVKNKASDLHLSAGLPPMIRVHGDVRRINLPPLEHKDVHGMIYDIMNDAQRKAYEEMLECDFSFAIPVWPVSASTPTTRSAALLPCCVPFRPRS
jgi:twitching motility protein PilT